MASAPSTNNSRIRIPTAEDFAPLAESDGIHVALHFPSPPESTVAIMVLLHGLGDSETNFVGFAKGMNLPGVLTVAVRGTSPLPPAMLGMTPEEAASSPPAHFHYGDDLRISGEGLDPDPGFEKATGKVLDKLVRGVIVEKCGWEARDVLLFGYGQGGSLALGLASRIRLGLTAGRVQELSDDDGGDDGTQFKGVVSVCGALPHSMVPSLSSRAKAKTHVLVCCGRESEAIDEDAEDTLKDEFETVQVERWPRVREDTMPHSREEMLPIMKFLADRLRAPEVAGGAAF